jgi:hypothetical protein
MRLFEIHRDTDESGVSGTGVVCQGVQFDDGQVAMVWLTSLRGYPQAYPSISLVESIHGHGGLTRVVWLDEQEAERSVTVGGKKVIIQSTRD